MKLHEMTTIYQRPLTQEKPEGKACLLSYKMTDSDGMQLWNVCFEGDDGAVYQRWINPRTPREATNCRCHK